MVDGIPEMLYSFRSGSLCKDGIGLIVQCWSHGACIDIEMLYVFNFYFIVFIYLGYYLHTLMSVYLSLPFSYLQ